MKRPSAASESGDPVGMIPQTPGEMRRECFGKIARVCDNISRCAMVQDADGVETHYALLAKAMKTLDIIISHMERQPG